ncbi:MAG: hypothetical protein CVU57_17240 [Deltaproteobacteria bacterium HGW-Deltaproteobacteria-15]|nr:MAG: hypothetical protein CVU57_17240 [Deltaproteobacteria bacterium HGW-Deltaproteobacteria-15]
MIGGNRKSGRKDEKMKGKAINPSYRRGKRNVFCRFYSKCLDAVIRKGWMHWNCAECEHRFNKEAAPEFPLNVNYSIAYYEVSTKV